MGSRSHCHLPIFPPERIVKFVSFPCKQALWGLKILNHERRIPDWINLEPQNTQIVEFYVAKKRKSTNLEAQKSWNTLLYPA